MPLGFAVAGSLNGFQQCLIKFGRREYGFHLLVFFCSLQIERPLVDQFGHGYLLSQGKTLEESGKIIVQCDINPYFAHGNVSLC